MSESNRLQINWVTSAGGALGAVSSAVLLSTLGAAGTLVGAALGSLCITVGGAVYSHYLAMTKERVAAQAIGARRSGPVREPVPVGAGAVPPHEAPGRIGESDLAARADQEGSTPQMLQGLPWKRIIAISAALFGTAMVLIVAFELSTGRAVSTYTGGTSNPGVGTSIPGWSGTGQQPPDAENDVQDGDVPTEQAPPEDGGVPTEQAPPEDGGVPPEQAPPTDGPLDEAPPTDAPPEEAPPTDAPQEEPTPELPPQQLAPDAPAT